MKLVWIFHIEISQFLKGLYNQRHFIIIIVNLRKSQPINQYFIQLSQTQIYYGIWFQFNVYLSSKYTELPNLNSGSNFVFYENIRSSLFKQQQLQSMTYHQQAEILHRQYHTYLNDHGR